MGLRRGAAARLDSARAARALPAGDGWLHLGGPCAGHRAGVAGFSQGAALAFAAASKKALPIRGVASLAGFLPAGGEGRELTPLKGLPVYWAHGTEDEFVPIFRAREGMNRLLQAGARLTACEAEVGHRLGAECMRGLRAWLAAEFGC